ncbi:MAG: hypothetical protein KAJ62_05715, partial [Desulfobacteraceae bacterium]|nr:hypothetical protein [Desulfobacteraceae bacterium]
IVGNCLLFCFLLVIFLWVQIFGFNGIHPYHQLWKTVMIVNSFFLIFLSCYWSFQNHERVQKIFLYGFSPILLFLCLNFLMPDLAIEKKAPGILLSNYSQNIAQDTLIISDNQTAGAACFFFKRNDIYVLGRAGELHYGFTYKDSKSRKIDIKEAVDLIKKNQGKIILIGKAKKINRWKSKLPKPVFQDDSGPEGYVFYKY